MVDTCRCPMDDSIPYYYYNRCHHRFFISSPHQESWHRQHYEDYVQWIYRSSVASVAHDNHLQMGTRRILSSARESGASLHILLLQPILRSSSFRSL